MTKDRLLRLCQAGGSFLLLIVLLFGEHCGLLQGAALALLSASLALRCTPKKAGGQNGGERP